MGALFIFLAETRPRDMREMGHTPDAVAEWKLCGKAFPEGRANSAWPCFRFVCRSLLVFFCPDGHSIVQSLDKESGDQDE